MLQRESVKVDGEGGRWVEGVSDEKAVDDQSLRGDRKRSACLLAATALEHDLVLVTRNTKDIAALPVEVFNSTPGSNEVQQGNSPEPALRTQSGPAAETSGNFSGHRIDSTDRSTSSIGQ